MLEVASITNLVPLLPSKKAVEFPEPIAPNKLRHAFEGERVVNTTKRSKRRFTVIKRCKPSSRSKMEMLTAHFTYTNKEQVFLPQSPSTVLFLVFWWFLFFFFAISLVQRYKQSS